jgi:hypothetical protein
MQARTAILIVLSLSDASLLCGVFLAYSVKDARGRLLIGALGGVRLVFIGAIIFAAYHGEWVAATWFAVVAASLWVTSVAVAIVSSAARVEPWVITLACNGGPVSGILSPAQWTYVWHKGRFSLLRGAGLICFTLLKAATVTIVWAYHIYYPEFAKAFGCYGTDSAITAYIYGYCPQYADEPYWSSASTVCRNDAMEGSAAHQCCNCPYKALPHAWHNWPSGVTIMAYIAFGVWCVQWVPATYHGRLLANKKTKGKRVPHKHDHAGKQAPTPA